MSSLIIRDVLEVDDQDKLEGIMSYFKKGQSHIAIVSKQMVGEHGRDPYRKVVGLLTLEDIIEEIIADELEDEFDQ